MLSLILGENSSSRLFQELRERRGLCYHVSSDVALFEETGALEITLALEPAQRDLALETIRREFDDLMRNGPDPGELERAKRYAIGQSKIGFETTASHLFWSGETLLHHGRIVDPEEVRSAIRRVSAEDVARAAEKILPASRMAVAEIAPETGAE
jgi:predicted Zn-dependent peptidase